jgi:DNA-binding transcriptional ArsR family regulator
MRQIKHPNLKQIELTDIMYALSDPARVEIVRRLYEEQQPMTCNALNLDRPKSSMSHHFKILREAGLLETRVEGKEHFNTLRVDEVDKRFPGLFTALLSVMQETRPQPSKLASGE